MEEDIHFSTFPNLARPRLIEQTEGGKYQPWEAALLLRVNAIPLQLQCLWIIWHDGPGRILLQHHPSLGCVREVDIRKQHKNLSLLNDVTDC